MYRVPTNIPLFVMRTPVLVLAISLLVASCSPAPHMATSEAPVEMAPSRFRVLVYSQTNGWRHDSIPAGIAAVKKLGEEKGFAVDATEDSTMFTPENLSRYQTVVFLNTTLDILNETQQEAFKGYIQQGGGFAGVHAAADTEYDWPWYGELVGAYFASHPDRQTAEVQITDRQHPSTAHMPARWNHYDEWYNYKVNPRSKVHVLAVINERTYEGGEMGHDHPIAWAHHFEGGRAWYTGMGHTVESYSDPLFLDHLLGGIEWTAGMKDGDVTATLASSYDEVVLTGDLTDPMEIDITTDGRVFIIEWAGAVKIWEPDTNEMRVIGWIPVDKIIEDGLLGMALDPNFDQNNWLYIYYSPIAKEGKPFNRLSRFTYDGRMIDMDSEVAMLEIPVQRVQCCHSAGSVQFDAKGDLYLSTGDNSGGERDSEDEYIRKLADQGRTTANTNDLRGKILRIRPQPDGTYTIPEGNLFDADEKHRGEIFTMGHRNPFRYSIDSKTGWIYWGDVGPGSGNGFDEFNRAKAPGYFGWPLFTGYNLPFDNYHFFGADDMTPYQDPEAPINASPFNTGARELPPAQPALIPYLYGMSEEFPELAAGGMNPMGGPVFHYNAATAHKHALPPYFDDKVVIYEWMRNWVQVMTLDEKGDILKIDPFLPGLDYIRPTDIEVGPDGRLYIIEWGDEFWGSNANAQLVRLDYYGNKPMPAERSMEEKPEAGPLAISLPKDGSIFDFDEAMSYEVKLQDQALADEVVVNTYSGFDTSPYWLAELSGLKGTFTIDHSFTHSPSVHYANRFAEIEACLDGTCDRVRLQPRTKEAEHTSDRANSRRITYSARSASEHWGGTALTVMQATDKTMLAYTPVNLEEVGSLTLRFRAEKSGRIDVRMEGIKGVLATVEITPEAGVPVRPHQADYLASIPPDASGLKQLQEGAYDNWREMIIPISSAKGTHTLTLDFSSQATGPFMELDWVRFNSPVVKE